MTEPLFEGRAPIAMAREVYGIRDPAGRRAAPQVHQVQNDEHGC